MILKVPPNQNPSMIPQFTTSRQSRATLPRILKTPWPIFPTFLSKIPETLVRTLHRASSCQILGWSHPPLGARLWSVTCDTESHPAPSFIFHSFSGLERDFKIFLIINPPTFLLVESSRKTLAVIEMFLPKEGASITRKVIKIYGMFNQTFPSFICFSIAGYYIISILLFFFLKCHKIKSASGSLGVYD